MGDYTSDKKNTRFYGLKLNRNTDAALIKWLDSQESVQGYLKQLIRVDMKGDNTMEYRIKPEYLDLYGDEATTETTLTADEIDSLAADWEKPVEELLDQLIPVNFEAAVHLMDDEIREALYKELSPCSEARFLWEYCKRHQKKYGEEFTI